MFIVTDYKDGIYTITQTLDDGKNKTCGVKNGQIVVGWSGKKLKSPAKYDELASIIAAVKKYIDLNNNGVVIRPEVAFVLKYCKTDVQIENLAPYFNKIESAVKIADANGFLGIVVQRHIARCIDDNIDDFEKHLDDVIFVLNNGEFIDEDVSYSTYHTSRCLWKASRFKKIVTFVKQSGQIDNAKDKKELIYKIDAMMSIGSNVDDDAILDLYRSEVYEQLAMFKTSPIKVIERYLDCCEKLGQQPSFKGNALARFYRTMKAYEALKNKIDAEKLLNVARRYANIEDFHLIFPEYGDFTAEIFKTTQDFIDEGEIQHNCVGKFAYDDKMRNGKCIVCGIRKNGEPYITCEVDTEDFSILQFYLKGNECPASFIDRTLEKEFQKFINKLFK